jgi:Ca2+-binding RTX toxin-like protein
VVVGRRGDLFGTDFGIEFYADRFTLVNQGTIAGNFGVGGIGDGTFIRNNGVITGDKMGLYLEGEGTVLINERRGFIQGENDWGVELKGDKATLVNHGEIYHAAGTDAAVFLNSATGETQSLTNTGMLIGDIAIFANFGDDVVTNKGGIQGDVRLGDGDDVFVNKGGWVKGVVNGEAGDDTYFIDSKAIQLAEDADRGIDYVHATVSYVLEDNFEQLILDGCASINGTGNDSDNAIYGNSGRNRLSGLGGNDLLSGLGGNDRLTGGEGADTFVFNGSGVDRIMDFAVGEDLISIDIKGIDDFEDLESRMGEAGGNVMIKTGNGDRLIIHDTALSDLDATDFLFA